jgi:hypothetical protein
VFSDLRSFKNFIGFYYKNLLERCRFAVFLVDIVLRKIIKYNLSLLKLDDLSQMKKFILIVSGFLYCYIVNAQENLRKCLVPEIGFTFYVPNELKDAPKSDAWYWDDRGNPIKGKYTVVVPKNTVYAPSKDDPNVLLHMKILDTNKLPILQLRFFLMDITETRKKIFNPQFQKEVDVDLANQSGDKFDSLFVKVNIGIYKFDKSLITNYTSNGNRYTGSYIGLYKNKYLSISFLCLDKNLAEKMMSLIEDGKFDQQ